MKLEQIAVGGRRQDAISNLCPSRSSGTGHRHSIESHGVASAGGPDALTRADPRRRLDVALGPRRSHPWAPTMEPLREQRRRDDVGRGARPEAWDARGGARRSWRPRARTARGTGSCVRRLPAACSHIVRCASSVVSAGLSAGREEVAQHPLDIVDYEGAVALPGV